MKYIVSFSGGKDSTAMLLRLLEEKRQVDYILFANTGVEFPQMYRHIEKVNYYIREKYNKKITTVRAKYDFIHYAIKYKKTKGKHKGKPYGFPSWNIRWCTTLLKQNPIKKFLKKHIPYKEYIGYAYDEKKRIKNNNTHLYPLIEWKMTEKDCLKYCYERGFDWEGLYEYFDRLSCWICPLKRKREMYIIMDKFPELWKQIIDMGQYLKEQNIPGYKFAKKDINELEKWLKKEVRK